MNERERERENGTKSFKGIINKKKATNNNKRVKLKYQHEKVNKKYSSKTKKK